MTYAEWEREVPAVIRSDSLWRVEAYRLSLFLSDLAWEDATVLLGDERTRGIANQLYRAAGNISANIAEGYSRHTGKQRALYYEYALGSVRETRDWYYKGRHVLPKAVVDHRLELSTSIIRLALKMTENERRTNRTVSNAKGALT